MAGGIASCPLGHAKSEDSNFVIGASTRRLHQGAGICGLALLGSVREDLGGRAGHAENPADASGGVLRGAASVGCRKRAHQSEGPGADRYWSIKSGSEKLIRGRHWSGVGNFGMGARPGVASLLRETGPCELEA
jgi:hypothetical protein